MSHSAVVTRAPSDIPEMLVHVTFFVFPVPICVRGVEGGSASLSLWDESAKAPCDEEGGSWGGRRAGITPLFCSHAHLLPLTPPGTRSDLCRDLASLFTLTHAFPSLLRGNRTKFLVHYKSFSGRPGRRSASSRLLFGSAAELCGAGSDSLSVAAEIAAVVSLNICFLC